MWNWVHRVPRSDRYPTRIYEANWHWGESVAIEPCHIPLHHQVYQLGYPQGLVGGVFKSKCICTCLAHFHTRDQDNATYFDVYQELTWNQAWLTQVGIAASNRFSPKVLVPPAITGLHNGDAIRAWITAGIVNVVGDNTRPVLMNAVNLEKCPTSAWVVFKMPQLTYLV